MISVLYSQRVQSTFTQLVEVFKNKKQLEKLLVDKGKPSERIRVRIAGPMTAIEMTQLEGLIMANTDNLGKWDETSIRDAQWNKKWFNSVKGVEIVLHRNSQGSHVPAQCQTEGYDAA